ncbi:glycerophosphodiester phosphodiesterase GDPD1, chloroplastic-like [Iris pallida]|uniref:glycerophosphodiester phosphodiesterase n=1 Tax=Iris pallida TaxID=29817 RepID=A0AAX6HU05_IRIPA|nr:glycerophosphodiester phosphodiesterase GDPD1, chloroplastic-like [Iris pallida]KAJ6843755.1 glycerophosphodiester phosphodiesterase GDPD1, chloroplastic-like [Iris pallida]
MALTAVHVSDVPMMGHVPEMQPAPALTRRSEPLDMRSAGEKAGKFLVVGHRGKGMNLLSSSDPRMTSFKENSVASFNAAGKFPVDLVEFDVQVTKDNYPIIFHDNFILTEEEGQILEKRATDLTLEEFFSYGPQKQSGKVGKSLLRKLKDGRVIDWNVGTDSPLCTLEEAFQSVDSHLGFNIELKFDDNLVYQEQELTRILQTILHVVFQHAHDRPVVFSSFQPDAAQVMRKLQCVYPVYFLTNGGIETYTDSRRNSLDEAIRHCLSYGLHGIVSEVKAIFRNPTMVPRIKESNLALLTYGQLNNVPEAVYMQHLMGINGVIVDLVEEITGSVSDIISKDEADEELGKSVGEGKEEKRPKFSQRELAFLFKLIPELVQH